MTVETKPGRKEISHERILDVAARAIRRNGCAGVGIADVMKQAGLTHGGFYAHFGSRETMLAEALDHARKASSESLSQRIAARRAHGDSPIRALAEAYLSEKHLVSPETGCPVAALGSEMPRQAPELREASRRQVQGLLAMAMAALPPGAAPENAMAIASTMVGALQLARVLGNNAQGKAQLAASRKALIDQYETNSDDRVKR
jgi:TetR/AcrR family transcriptional regulator, transcriptional repressor for nem operon